MPKYRVRIPQGLYKINASNRRDAIDKALEIYKDELAQFCESGKIYSVPSICMESKPKDAMLEMSIEQPIKPSRKLDNPKRR